tara:strand:- start:1299 stop:2273 length:975 start_codon:yes stop_codon:yes gene_type:complete
MSDEKPKLIENKKNKSNNFVFIFNFLLFVILLCSIGFSAYIWINLENNNNEELLLELRASIFDKINENSRKNNFEITNEINNLYSKKITQLTDISLKLEDRQNKTELNNKKIISQLIALENKINSLVKDLDQKVKINNSPNINKETKNPTQIHETDLEQILETLNLNFQKNKNWSKEIKAIFEHNNESFINHFSRELDVLKNYAYLPPPTLDELKFSFNVLLPSILQNLPSQNKSFLNDKINWIISSIKLRKSEISDGNEPYDFLSNVDYYLDKENLDKVVDNFENLPATMKKPALDWFENLNSRISVNNSINAISNNYRNFIK